MEVRGSLDATSGYGMNYEAPLGDFASRPIKLTEVIWTTTASTFDVTIDPWSLILDDTRLKKRLEGFKLLRAKLHLRLVVNGNPFLYGMAIAAYKPRYPDEFAGANAPLALITELSMLPHVYLNPTVSEAGEMVLPFFCPDNWIDLVAGTQANMGRLRLASVNKLTNVLGTLASAQISVFGWLDEVEVCTTTGASYNTYTVQSGTEYGRISTPASAFARWTGQLAETPIIGPYMRATSMLSSAVGNMASLFGFSRPAVVTPLERIKPHSMGILSNTDQHEAVVKLAFDAKQELCIDPRTTGLDGTDEMAFAHIVTKQAFVTTMNWDYAATDGTELGSMAVNPYVYNTDSTGLNVITSIVNTPISTVAMMFRFWKGTIKYRFQIVASAYHRGRVRLIYDPCGDSSTLDYNAAYSRIIDLSTERDFEYEVAWHAGRSFLRAPPLSSTLFATPYPFLPYNPSVSNGKWRLVVVNQLTGPDTTVAESVYINVFVSATPDFQVAEPHDLITRAFTYRAQSGYEPQSGEEVQGLAGQDSTNMSDSIGLVDNSYDASSHVFFGESICTFRSLLKRYCYHSVFGTYSVGTSFWWREYDFPYYPGVNLGSNVAEYRHAGDPAIGGTALNICSPLPLHWVVPCYAGWRGSLRTKYVFPTRATMFVRRDTSESRDVRFAKGIVTVGDDDANTKKMFQIFNSGFSGMHAVKSEVDGALEVDFPFYANQRFASARKFIHTTPTNEKTGLTSHLGLLLSADTEKSFGIFRMVAAGDDFSTFFWLGQPRLYFGDLNWTAPMEEEGLPDDYVSE